MTAGNSHDPRELHEYMQFHENWMQTFMRDEFVLADTVAFEDLGNGFILGSGRIPCKGDIKIDVTKMLAIRGGSGRTALVQTVRYSYHVIVENVGNVFRYCSPHDDHRQFHHKHSFDIFGTGTETCVECPWPTLGEVIIVAREWYYANYDAVERAIAGARRP